MSMDRRIERSPKKRWIAGLGAVAVAAALVALIAPQLTSGTAYTVDGRRVRIATVTEGNFEDYIPLRGAVEPLKTVYLDAIEGGRVERVLVEEGALVEVGDPLVELSNTQLQLDVIAREAEVSEQLNNLRNTQLAIEQNRLKLKSDLVEIDYQIVRLERLLARREAMAEKELISRDEIETVEDELTYWRNRREVTLESQDVDERLREAQIVQLESSIENLQANLSIARANLENLLVRAPRAGKLTSFDVDVGESKRRGERLGQIDDIDRFKAVGQVNEFYINRVRVGQQAAFTQNGRSFEMTVSKVYPEVSNGQFEIDLAFAEIQPETVRRGQTLQLRLELGDRSRALLLDNGPFLQDTGGVWVFALGEGGAVAHRTRVQLGRRNPQAIEVIEGLQAGDRVIVSEYSGFLEVDRLNIAD
ncbi:MAG: HlyD family efflux transporter periplasmic adaptor subunit [Pseudomonadota bacterium]